MVANDRTVARVQELGRFGPVACRPGRQDLDFHVRRQACERRLTDRVQRRQVVFAKGAGMYMVQRSSGWHRSNAVRVEEHARRRGHCTDERELARVSTVRKAAFASAQQERIDRQHDFVDQSLLE